MFPSRPCGWCHRYVEGELDLLAHQQKDPFCRALQRRGVLVTRGFMAIDHESDAPLYARAEVEVVCAVQPGGFLPRDVDVVHYAPVWAVFTVEALRNRGDADQQVEVALRRLLDRIGDAGARALYALGGVDAVVSYARESP